MNLFKKTRTTNQDCVSTSSQEDKTQRQNFSYIFDSLQTRYLDDREAFAELSFIITSLRREDRASLPECIAVVGPTQSGKSTIVNTIVGQSCARVSQKAAFTSDLEVFQTETCTADCQQLLPTALQSYVFRQPSETRWIVLDTPDIDASDCHQFALAHAAVALATTSVLVVTPEKYKDRSVWSFVERTFDRTQSIWFHINKLSASEKSQTALLEDLRAYAAARGFRIFITTSGYYSSLEDRLPEAVANLLREELETRLQSSSRPLVSAAQLHHAWETYGSELQKQVRDDEIIRRATDELRKRLVADGTSYLESLEAPADRILTGLMECLEVPGISVVMSTVRALVTWPFRKLVDFRRSKAAERAERSRRQLNFNKTLQQWCQLQPTKSTATTLSTAQITNFWEVYDAAGKNCYHAYLQSAEVQAKEIYIELKKKPALLQSLRALRLTVDVSLAVLAVSVGGLSPSDLVLAPAVLAVSTLLAESSAAGYLHRAERKLLQQYQQCLNERLQKDLTDELRAMLTSSLPDKLVDAVLAVKQNTTEPR